MLDFSVAEVACVPKTELSPAPEASSQKITCFSKEASRALWRSKLLDTDVGTLQIGNPTYRLQVKTKSRRAFVTRFS
jgi:hypothetical protein